MRNPLPSADTFARAKPALLGFGAGLIGMLVITAFSTVVYSGHGLWADPVPPSQVYTDF